MATQQGLTPLSYVASGDLSAKQFYAVKANGDGTVAIIAAVTDRVAGIVQEPATAGKAVAIAASGQVKWLAGATLAAGDAVSTDNAGKAVPVGTGTKSHGTCVRGAASGEYAEVLLSLNGYS